MPDLTVSSAVDTLMQASNQAGLRSALALGNSATLDTGTTAGTVATGDHTHNASAITAGTLDAARLPTPGTSTLGGVMRNAGSAGQFVNGINSSGQLTYATPSGGSGDVVWDYLGAFTASAAAQVNADNIFDGTIYDEYEIDLVSTPVTNTVSLVMYLRDSTPANAVTIRRAGGVFMRMDSASVGTAGQASALGVNIANTIPSKISIRLVQRTDMNHYGTATLSLTTSGGVFVSQYSFDFADTTLRQGVGFGYSSGNVSSATLRVWGRRKPV